MPSELQAAVIGFIIVLLTGASSVVGALIHSAVSRRQDQDLLKKNQTTFEAAILKNQTEFDQKYQSFFVDRVAVLLDERKQLWSERSKIAEDFLTYQRDASASVTRSEEAVKRLEERLSNQADKLSRFEKDILVITQDRDSILKKMEDVIAERDTLSVSLRQSQELISKQMESVKELELLKSQYGMLEKRVYELEENEKRLISQVHQLETNEAVLKREANIYKEDRDQLIETLAKVANGNGKRVKSDEKTTSGVGGSSEGGAKGRRLPAAQDREDQ